MRVPERTPPVQQWNRFVALGDSTTEGLEDLAQDGGYRGFADRLAEHVAEAQDTPLMYANLAVRGRKAAEVRYEQLPVALEMRPDLASVVVGVNDVLRVTHDLDETLAHVFAMLSSLTATGATVVTFTFPDLSQVMPVAKLLGSRQRVLNQGIREAARRTGALLADLEHHELGLDLRYWHTDRLHGSPHGHAMLAGILAAQLGLSVRTAPLDGLPAPRGWRGEVGWVREHLLDYVTRHARGIKLGDGITAKRPQLLPVLPPGGP